jgi:hypothetical protein
MFIPDPGSSIPDPATTTKEEGEKLMSYLFYSRKFHIKIFFIFEYVRRNLEPVDIELKYFYPKIVIKLLKIRLGVGIRDPGSGKTLSRIRFEGSKDTGFRTQIRNTDRNVYREGVISCS